MSGILQRHKLDWDAVAFLSDDLADIPVLRRVALPVAVANAVPEVIA
ncbi:MAG: phenylphosphate carboxylase subunit delta, partial [Gemmatimonadetes bacterium]|nr:phenylphosphate carboxylase subunit delta [Gemmatimonadota bacterium]NIV22799.1 phenylphosphate carboxylase subunit delta [Gemmatimonadota bacterium]NIW74327.1 phenylphosphate carboxylase subunit delta [Gemmatimonadota bacterium]NIY42713.1 phenylphosphate carboxylase subunit delta [Gemmatimonadota bacterium]